MRLKSCLLCCLIVLAYVPSMAQQSLVGQLFNGEHDFLFRFDPQTATVDTLGLLLANQDPSNIYSQSRGGLILTQSGTIYGSSEYGGRYFRGSIHVVDTISSTRITLCEFPDTLLGKRPHGQLFETAQGTLIGFATEGGLFGCGTVFEFDPASNTLQKLLDLGPTPFLFPNTSIVVHPNGKFYIGKADYAWGGSSAYTFDPTTNILSSILQIPIQNDAIIDMVVLPDDRILFSTAQSWNLPCYVGTFQPDGSNVTLDIAYPPEGQGVQAHYADRLIHLPATNDVYAVDGSGGPLGTGGVVKIDLVNGISQLVYMHPDAGWAHSVSALVLTSPSSFRGAVNNLYGTTRECFEFDIAGDTYTVIRSDTNGGLVSNDPVSIAGDLWFLDTPLDASETGKEHVLVLREQSNDLDTLASTRTCGSPYSSASSHIERLSNGKGLFTQWSCQTERITFLTIDPGNGGIDTLAYDLASTSSSWHSFDLFPNDSALITISASPVDSILIVAKIGLYDGSVDTLVDLSNGQAIYSHYMHGDSLILLNFVGDSGGISILDLNTEIISPVHAFNNTEYPWGLIRASDGWYYGVTIALNNQDQPSLYRLNASTGVVEILYASDIWTRFGKDLEERVNSNGEPTIVGSLQNQAGGFIWNLSIDTMALFYFDQFTCHDPVAYQHAIGNDGRWYGYTNKYAGGFFPDTTYVYSNDPDQWTHECHGPLTTWSGGALGQYWELAALYPDSGPVEAIHELEFPGSLNQLNVRYDQDGQYLLWNWPLVRGLALISLYDVAGRLLWSTAAPNNGKFTVPRDLDWPGVGVAQLSISGRFIGAAKVLDITTADF